MQFDIAKLESMGIVIEHDRQKRKLTITGDVPIDEMLCKAYRDMESALTSHLPGIKGFEASRLVEDFAEDVHDRALLNQLKDCQDK